MKRTGLYVTIPDGEVRWQIKRAALEERRTVRALVLDILTDWLLAHGYAIQRPADSHTAVLPLETPG